jgi:hypothetical protein
MTKMSFVDCRDEGDRASNDRGCRQHDFRRSPIFREEREVSEGLGCDDADDPTRYPPNGESSVRIFGKTETESDEKSEDSFHSKDDFRTKRNVSC